VECAFNVKAMQERHNAEVADIHSTLERWEASADADRAKYIKRHSEFDGHCNKLHSLIQEQRVALEGRLSTIEPRVDTARFRLDSLKEEFAEDLTGLRNEFAGIESSLRQTLQTAQQAMEDQANTLKEMSVQQDVSIKELDSKLQRDILHVLTNCDVLKESVKNDCDSSLAKLEDNLVQRHLASATATSQQINELVEVVKIDSARGMHDMHEWIDEVRRNFSVDYRTLEESLRSQCFFMIRDKCAEERANNKKCQDELMQLLEIERDTRLQQGTELRLELVKAIAKGAEQNSFMSKSKKNWGLASSYNTNILTPISSSTALSGGSNYDSLLIGCAK